MSTDKRIDGVSAIVSWGVGLVVVLIVAGLANSVQSTVLEGDQLRRTQAANFRGEQDETPAAQLILDHLQHNTPWLLYAFLGWIALLLGRVILELQKLRERAERPGESRQ